jgi:hypothetical protein
VYTYRDSGDASGNLPYRRRFIKTENIIIPLGQFEAYKFEYLATEALGIADIQFYDWIGKNGLLKRYIDSGMNILSDSLGDSIGTVRTYDITELVGQTDINPDTLKPWGAQ